jgi:hypothetical protein
LDVVLALLVQFRAGLHIPDHATLLAPLAALLIFTGGGLLLLAGAGWVVPRTLRARRARIARRRRLRAAASAELRARASMDELCPFGWHAEIALIGVSEHPDADRPRDSVAVVWTEYEDESRRTGVVRRLQAPTIHEALEAMVADRRMDVTLQGIEQSALADGAFWPDD